MGTFARAFSLPEGVDPGAISATFSNGVLEVRIPKPSKPARKSVPIEIKAAL